MSPPVPPLMGRDDSSTGLGQIFAPTAIAATNWWNNSTVYNANNTKDLHEVWKKLKYDDEYNIDMVAMVLAHKRHLLKDTITNPTPKDVFKKYNGSGAWAEKYKEVVNQYYEAFKAYNVEN